MAVDFAEESDGFTRAVLRREVAEAKQVGRKHCTICKAPTPLPSEKRLMELMGNGDNFVWPFDDYWPTGWLSGAIYSAENGERSAVRSPVLCPKCVSKRSLR